MNLDRIKKRDSNIELLRIFALLLITAHHYALYGILQSPSADSDILFHSLSDFRQIITHIFFVGGDIGNVIFFVVTGYFLIYAARSNFKGFILEVVFYCFLQLIIFSINTLFFDGSFYHSLSEYDKEKAFWGYLLAPFSSSRFWFASAYLILVIVSPIFNTFLLKLNKVGFLVFIIFSFVIWVAVGTFYVYPYLGIVKAFAFYAIGAYLKLFVVQNRVSKSPIKILNFFVFVISMLSMALICFGKDNYWNLILSNHFNYFFFRQFVYGVLSVVCAISLFLLLRSFSFKSFTVNIVASTTFGIYLCQEGLFNRIVIWRNFDFIRDHYLSNNYYCYALITIIVLFLIFAVVDLVRQIVFEPIYLKLSNCFNCFFKSK